MDSKDNMSFINRWFLESSESTRNELDLQLMSLTAEKPPLAGQGLGTEPSPTIMPPFINDVPLHHHPPPPPVGGIPEPHYDPLNYWLPQDKEGLYPNDLLSANHQHNGFDQLNYGISGFPPITSSDHSIQMLQQVSSVSNDNAVFRQMQEPIVEIDNIIIGESCNNGHAVYKRTGTILPNSEKKPRTLIDNPAPTESSSRRVVVPRKSAEVEINGVTMDIALIPIPVCSCTGIPRLCYRWGSGGWQSSCCTNSLSSYPLPTNTKRHGTRIAGRKMSIGGFKKVLEKLASEGYDFSVPIDLRSCWAKHGTNKFVTIR